MEQTVYNPQKGRLETINIDFTDETTTWFDECEDSQANAVYLPVKVSTFVVKFENSNGRTGIYQ